VAFPAEFALLLFFATARGASGERILRASASVKKCELTAGHVFGLLYKLEPYADLAARHPLLAACMPVLDDLVMVHGEIVRSRLILQRACDRRPVALRHDRKFVPSIVQQQGDYRLGHLRVRRLSSHEGVYLRRLVVRAFLQERTITDVNGIVASVLPSLPELAIVIGPPSSGPLYF